MENKSRARSQTQTEHTLWIYLIKIQKQKREISGVSSWGSGYIGARALKSIQYTMIYYEWLHVSTFTRSFVTELLLRAAPFMKKKGPIFHNCWPSMRTEAHRIRTWCWWLGGKGTWNYMLDRNSVSMGTMENDIDINNHGASTPSVCNLLKGSHGR